MKHDEPSRCALLMFSLYAAHATYSPFLSLYLQDAGLDVVQIGMVLSACRLVSIVAVPVVCLYADRKRNHGTIVTTLAGLATIPLTVMYALGTSSANSGGAVDPLLLCLLLSCYTACSAPKAPLVDEVVLQTIGSSSSSRAHGGGDSGDSHSYANCRLWGSISWGVVSWGVGQFTSVFPTGGRPYLHIPLLHAVALGWLAIILWRYFREDHVMHSLRPSQQVAEEGEPVGETRTWWSSLHEYRSLARSIAETVFSSPTLLVFLCCVASVSIAENAMNTWLFPHMRSKWRENPSELSKLFGYSLLIDVVSEVCIFRVASWLLRRATCFSLLALSALVFGIKALCYGSLQSPHQMLFVEVIHGFGFALLWSSAVSFVDSTFLSRKEAGPDPSGGRGSMMMLWLWYSGFPPLIASGVSSFVVQHFSYRDAGVVESSAVQLVSTAGTTTLFRFISAFCFFVTLVCFVCSKIC